MNAASLFCGALFDSERGGLLQRVLRDATQDRELILALEHAELAVAAPQGGMLPAQALDAGTVLPGLTPLFLNDPILARRVRVVPLEEVEPPLALDVPQPRCESLAAFHRVRIDAAVLPQIVERSMSLPGLLPGKAISLPDAATSRAAMEEADQLVLCHVYLAAAAWA